MGKKEYRVICFCGENEIFVGVVESYILDGKRYPKYPGVETLQFFPYDKGTKYATIDYEGSLGCLFDIYEGKIKRISETNNFHFGLDDKKEHHDFQGGEGLGYFQLEPDKGIWIENGGYATGRFRLIEGKENIVRMINSLM